MARVIFSENFTGFVGGGFAPAPVAGQLDSNFWSITGLSDGDVPFGGTGVSGDFARGATGGGVSTGGVYGLDLADDQALMIQPTGDDFTPGELTLLAANTEDVALSDVTVFFDLLVNNDQSRGNVLEFDFTVNGVDFLPVPALSFESPEVADALGFVSTPVMATLDDVTLASGATLQLRWTGDDATGGGARDEFAIDNVMVTGEAPTILPAFTLELLHVTDQEGGTGDIGDIARLSGILNALEAQDIAGVEENTLRLSSGDAIIPGVFFDASAAVFGSSGIADIQIQNELGFEAIALGNHEFDNGTGVLAGLIAGSAPGDILAADFGGAAFPYLSSNLDFSADPNLAPLEVPGGQAPQSGTVTSSVLLDVNGEPIGVVGATTPTLNAISSPGSLGIAPSPFGVDPTDEEITALATIIQSEVDALLAANEGLNKIVLLAHMQQIAIEERLAELLENVDIIVAGGSNTRLFDADDRARTGDSDQGQYPREVTNAGGTTTLIVNTDGSYKYVGRLVIDFDADGNVIAESYDEMVSGAYATDAQGLADVAALTGLDAEALIDPEIRQIVDALSAEIASTQGNVFGVSEVYLNRDSGATTDGPDDIGGERTQETALGNLTADANLFYAERLLADDIEVSIKNGGGIRAPIGETIVPPGGTEAVQVPNQAFTDEAGNIVKPEGGISEPDIKATLAFNNDLVVLTLTSAEIVGLLEHGVAAMPTASGRFPQISGLEFSFDPDQTDGSQIRNAGIFDADGALIAELVRDGEIVAPDATFDVATLEFLARPRFNDAGDFVGGGDGYPFPNYNTDALGEFEGDVAGTEAGDPAVIARLDATFLNSPIEGDDSSDFEDPDGAADFAAVGTEQDALAEYLNANFNPFSGAGEAFARPDVGPAGDERIQNLVFREDGVFDDVSPFTLISAIQGAPEDWTTQIGRDDASPLIGQVVTVEAVVVGDFQDGVGANGDLNGFYLQEEDADADDDARTSEGVFVFQGANPDIDLETGDKVRVTGTVDEFFGETQIDTVTEIVVVEKGVALPTAAEIAFPVASTRVNAAGEIIADLEAYEGMRVTVPQEMTVSDLFTLGRFGDIGLHADGRLPVFTQANAPSVEGFVAYQDLAVRNTLLLDDGSTIQNPPTIPFDVASAPGNFPGQLDANDELRVGDTVEDLTGVIRFSRGSGPSGDEAYRLNPTEAPVFENDNPRPIEAPEVGGSLKVASFNVLNYFTSLGDEGLTSGPDGASPRGADNALEFARQTEKLVAALSEIRADVFGLIEIENEFSDQNGDGEFAIQTLVDALNSATGASYDWVDPGAGFVGSDAIAVGFIYDADSLKIAEGTSVEFLTDDSLAGLGIDFGNPVFNGEGTSRAPLVAAFEQTATGEVFNLAVNHLKSKGSVSPFGDNTGTGDGTGNNNEARTQAAIALDAWLDTDPTGSGDDDFLIIGDLNAYAMEDPLSFLSDQGYTDLAAAFAEPDAPSYSFGFPIDLDTSPQVQAFGTLDYGLANANLLAQVTGAAEWHINADEASVFDYNTNFKPEEQVVGLYAADPFRSSDHDPIIIGLDLGGTEPETAVARIAFDERSNRDVAVYSLDGKDVASERLVRNQREIVLEEAGLTIGADDGLRFSPEFVTTAGKGVGVRSIFGDRQFGRERETLDGAETLSFQLEDGSGLGNALDVAFEFATVRKSGQVALSFFDDGIEVDSVSLDLEDDAVRHDLVGEQSFDRVEIGVEGPLGLTIGAVEFLRLQSDEFSWA